MPSKPPARRSRARDAVEVAERVKATLTKIGPDLFQYYTEITTASDKNRIGSIAYWWEVGRKFHVAGAKYQQAGATALARACRINESSSRAAVRFYAAYPSHQAFTDVATQKGPSGATLLWRHLRVLGSPELDPAARAKFVDRCLKHEWDPDTLARAIADYRAKLAGVAAAPEVGRGGRGIAVPRTLPAAVAKLDQMTRVLEKYVDAFYGDGDAVSAALAGTPAERITPEALAKLDAVQALFARVIAAGPRVLEVLSRCTDEARGILAGTAGIPAGSAGAAEPAATAGEDAAAAARAVKRAAEVGEAPATPPPPARAKVRKL